MTSCFSKLPEARPLVLCTPLLSAPTTQGGGPTLQSPLAHPLWPGFVAGGAVRMGAGASSAAPFSAAGPTLALPWLSKLLPGPPKLVTPGSRPRSYLTMQHLVARLPGALPPSRLFPYLGGKRNRETEGDRSGRPGVLPVQPSLGRRHQAATRVGAPGSSASAAGRGGCLRFPATALRLCTLSLAASQVQLPLSLRSPASRAQCPPPPHTRARRHTRPPQTHGCTHINTCCAPTRTPTDAERSVGTSVHDQGTPGWQGFGQSAGWWLRETS